MAALRNKKTKELELDRIAGTRLTLETQVCVYLLYLLASHRVLYPHLRYLQQRSNEKDCKADVQVNALESANLNAETMLAMKKGSEALKGIHTSLYVFSQSPGIIGGILIVSNVDKVDQTMDSIREQMDLTNEISDAISNPVGMGNQVDEVSPYAFLRPNLDALTTIGHMLTNRTSSRRNLKLSSRRNWTTDLQVPNERLYTLQPPQSESPQDESVRLILLSLHD